MSSFKTRREYVLFAVLVFWGTIAFSTACYCQINHLTESPHRSVTQIAYGTVGCGDGPDESNTRTKHKGPLPRSFESEDSCRLLYSTGKNLIDLGYPSAWRQADDTLRHFVESCATSPTAADGFPAFSAFGEISFAVRGMDTVNSRWLEYREWLKQVLYLNPDTGYYCADVSAMFATFNYLVPGKGIDTAASLAVGDYIANSGKCPYEDSLWWLGRQRIRAAQVKAWRDTVVDSLKTPLDTVNLSIDSIGFSILRGPQYASALPATFHQTIGMGELIASKNPFSDATTLQTSIENSMSLRLDVFDVLGKKLYGESRFFNAGQVRWTIDGSSLPNGTLYARISTIGGALRTIKIRRVD